MAAVVPLPWKDVHRRPCGPAANTQLHILPGALVEDPTNVSAIPWTLAPNYPINSYWAYQGVNIPQAGAMTTVCS
jgi:hypothetical protein